MFASLELIPDKSSLNDGKHILLRFDNNFCYLPVARSFSNKKHTKAEKDNIIDTLEKLVHSYNNRCNNGLEEAYNIEKCFYLSEDEFCGAFFYWKTMSKEKHFSEALDIFIDMLLDSGYRFVGLDKTGMPLRRIYSPNVINILLDAAGLFNEFLNFTTGATFIFKYLHLLMYYNRQGDHEYFSNNFSFFSEPANLSMTPINMSLEQNLH